jgi:hypothetical protein
VREEKERAVGLKWLMAAAMQERKRGQLGARVMAAAMQATEQAS